MCACVAKSATIALYPRRIASVTRWPQYVADELAKATDAFIEHRLDHPKENALEVMAKLVE
jgi:hypothetical protein